MPDSIARLAAHLVDAGVDRAFGVSGSGPSYQLISALKQRGVQYLPVSHEAVAPVAAGSYGFHTGRRAVAISIKGPGLANMMGGICAAYLEGYSPICIAENYDDAVAGERMHKRFDQHLLAGGVVDGMYSLFDLDRLPTVLAAHHWASRPLYIDLSKTTVRQPAAAPDLAAIAPDRERWAAFTARLAAAERPIAIVGSLAMRRGWQSQIEALQIPVFTTVQAKGTLDERKANAAGIYTGVGKALAAEAELIPQSDLVVTVGLRNMEILGVAGKRAFENFDLPHPLATPTDWLTDGAMLLELFSLLAAKPAWGVETIARQRDRWADYVGSYEWMPGQVFSAIDDLDWPHVLVLDTGTFCTIGEHVWDAVPGRRFLGSSNGRNLGLGVPHALGATCAHPGEPVFCVAGDGGIRYYFSDLRSLVEMGAPVCFILMKDGRYGSIACNVPSAPPDPNILNPLGTSWLRTVQAMGVGGGEASSAASFRQLLHAWDRATPYFIEASFDADTYLHVADAIRG